MSRLKPFLIFWLPVLVWFCVISAASGDQKSFQHSSRIIGPIVHWLFPQMPEEQVREVVFYVRKLAHMAEFGVMALFCWRGFSRVWPGKPDWTYAAARNAMWLTFAFAAVDELHQCFVPARQGSAWDVLIDCSGGALALACLWGFGKWRRWW